jgi:predicted nucleic acid-binding protein
LPSFDAFLQAGRVIAALATCERLAVAAGSFTNDVILASACRESDVVLVTENLRDFAAIQRHLRGFRFDDPGKLLS